MRVLIAMDSFKGSLSALEACQAVAQGLMSAHTGFECDLMPISDGGEGFAATLAVATGGQMVEVEVDGPLGAPVLAQYARLPDGSAAIEMAAAAGLTLLLPEQRNPLKTTTLGVGQLMAHALESGARTLYIGLGGSATNDGGLGLLCGLGGYLTDETGEPLFPSGENLERVAALHLEGLNPLLREARIVAACDVDNPLCGPQGASHVFGPQKGADPAMVERLDAGLEHLAGVVERQLGRDMCTPPGSGAAGGVGGCLTAILDAELTSGIDLALACAGAERRISESQLVVVGEGNTDAQTAHGKAPAGITRLAARLARPVVCLSGGLGEGYEQLYSLGLTAAFPAVCAPMPLERALALALPLLTQRAQDLGRVWVAAAGLKAEAAKKD